MKKLCCLLCVMLLLTGCGTDKKMAPKEGRISIHSDSHHQLVKTQDPVYLDEVHSDISWQQANANARNHIPHGQIGTHIAKKWSRNVGKGLSADYFVLPEPIIVNQKIYVLDSALRLTVLDENTGSQINQIQLPLSEDMGMNSIGLSSDGEQIYIVCGNGVVYATDLSGKIIWEYNTHAILRSAPTVANNLIFILSGNNELFVLNAKDGTEKWRYKNIKTDTNLFGMGKVAVSKGIAIVPFSSGEIIAFDIQTGMIQWADTLLSYRTFSPIDDLSHIVASPVIVNDTVYLVGNAKKTGAYALQTGDVRFIQNIGGQNTPVVNGNALFMITTQNTLIALNTTNGHTVWETNLTSKETNGIAWKGPVLINNQLVIVSNKGDILFIDALNGSLKQHLQNESFSNKPILGTNKVIFYTNDADLIAYQ